MMRDHVRATCATCGNIHPKCTGHRKSDKQPCMMNPSEGAAVCRMHGGGAPQVKKKAAARVQLRETQAAIVKFGLDLDVDPGTALLNEVRRSAGTVAWLSAQIERVMGAEPDGLVRGTKGVSRTAGRSVEGPVDMTTTSVGPQVHLWWEVWAKERAHLVKACAAAIAAGVAERQVRLAEQSGERAGMWLRATLSVLDLDESMMRQVMQAGVANLHLLEGAA